MPHFIIDYAAPLEDTPGFDAQTLVKAVCDAARASALFGPDDIKGRAVPFKAYETAGGEQAFVHVDIKLMPGRTDAQKHTLSRAVFDAVCAHVGDGPAVSVEINDLFKPGYIKRL